MALTPHQILPINLGNIVRLQAVILNRAYFLSYPGTTLHLTPLRHSRMEKDFTQLKNISPLAVLTKMSAKSNQIRPQNVFL